MRGLRLPDRLAERIRAHGATTYPNECCGALLGRDGEAGRVVEELVPQPNSHAGSPRTRFIIEAEEVRRVEATARRRGLDLIGWYHSHPDHPARPSAFDREHAWPFYSYIVLAVYGGEAKRLSSWRLRADRSGFDAEPIEPFPGGSTPPRDGNHAGDATGSEPTWP